MESKTGKVVNRKKLRSFLEDKEFCEYLTLERDETDPTFPSTSKELYRLAITNSPNGSYSEECRFCFHFLSTPNAYVFSRGIYDELFDKINSRENFFRLSGEFRQPAEDLLRLLYLLREQSI